MKKIVCLILFAVFCCAFYKEVSALEYFKAGDYVSKIYIKKEKDNVKKYLRVQWIHRVADGQFVYCLEPWVLLGENDGYNINVFNNQMNYHINSETLEKINLLAYYGYGYENHTDVSWYAITQLLIWKTVDPDGDFYFTETLNGTRVEKFISEINELYALVENHYKLPSFANKEITESIKKDLRLVDNNNQLKYFEVIDNNQVVKEKDNNIVTIRSDIKQVVNLELVKKTNRYNNIPIIYTHDVHQDLVSVGNYSTISTNVKINFETGTINLSKKDSVTKALPDNKYVTLKGAEYGVFDIDNNLIGKVITDSSGKGSLENIPLGIYFIKEIVPSNGYNLDKKTYEVELDSNKKDVSLVVYEDLKKIEFNIYKEYYDATLDNYYIEEGIVFDIYEKETDKLLESITTNEQGICNIKLLYGIYIVKQRNSKDGYQKVDSFEITINSDSTSTIQKKLINYPIEKKIEVPNTSKKEMSINFIVIILLTINHGLKKYYETY